MQPSIFGESVQEETVPSDLSCCVPQIPVLAELLCSEPTDEELMRSVTDQSRGHPDSPCSVPSYFDPVILHHPKVLERLRILEAGAEKTRDYFKTGREEILPYMRKVVASWMLEVCEEQRCDEAVFPLSVALLDTFLGCTLIKKEHLQLAASVCLLIATKSRQCNNFAPELLAWYTDNSVTPQSLRSWELMILSQLNWDVNIITPTDFIDFFLVRCPGMPSKPNKESLLVRRHALTFIALCSTEPRFVGLKPSLIAASAIYTALKGVGREEIILRKSLINLAQLANTTSDQLVSTSTSIEQVISTELAAIEQQTIDISHSSGKLNSSNSSASVASSSASLSSNKNCLSPVFGKSCFEQFEHSVYSGSGQISPTDVQDVIV